MWRTHNRLGSLAVAQALFQRALRIDEAALGPDHPDVAIEVWNLGTVLQAQGERAQARQAYQRALDIFERALPADHPDIRGVRGFLARLEETTEKGRPTTGD